MSPPGGYSLYGPVLSSTGDRGDEEGLPLNRVLVEVGPRLSFESAVSSNAKSVCRASGVEGVTRLEVRHDAIHVMMSL